MNPYYLDYQENSSPQDINILFHNINEETAKKKGYKKIRPFSLFIRNKQGEVLGGATGISYYGCLYVDMLWVHEQLRHQGWGTQLMHHAESIGKERDCTFATVNTMDWEALPFYQKLGYHVEFIREGYYQDSKFYFLRKSLTNNIA